MDFALLFDEFGFAFLSLSVLHQCVFNCQEIVFMNKLYTKLRSQNLLRLFIIPENKATNLNTRSRISRVILAV